MQPLEKKTREKLSKNLNINLISSFLQNVEQEELKIFLKDILEDEVDEKYYLSEKAIKRIKKGRLNPVIAHCLHCGGHSGGNHSDMDAIIKVGDIKQTCLKRKFETPVEINQFLKDNKKGFSIQQISDNTEIPKTQLEHYFRIDKSRAIPSPENWIKIKNFLQFNNTYDKQVTEIYEKEITYESTRRVYSAEGCSPCISSANADKIIQLNTPIHSNFPTLNTMQSGNRQPFILSSTQKNSTLRNDGLSNCLPSAMGLGGGHTPMIISNKIIQLKQPFIAASRGRNPNNPSDKTVGTQTEQRLEPNLNGTSNCLSTVQKDNYVCIVNATKKGYQEAYPGDGINLEQPNSKTRRARVQDKSIGCLQTNNQRGVITDDLKIRRLTPKECFRLMGFLNDEINLEGLSDTQRYKLAGNGWDINLVSKIFKEMFKT